VLAIFNMIPIPPLDGSRIALSLMPGVLARPYAKLERFGFMILLGIIFLLPVLGRQLGVDLNVFRWLVGVPLAYLMPMFRWLRVSPAEVQSAPVRPTMTLVGRSRAAVFRTALLKKQVA
jgi:Zn-dependent protease